MHQCTQCFYAFCDDCFYKGMGGSHCHEPVITAHLRRPQPPDNYYKLYANKPEEVTRQCNMCHGLCSHQSSLR